MGPRPYWFQHRTQNGMAIHHTWIQESRLNLSRLQDVYSSYRAYAKLTPLDIVREIAETAYKFDCETSIKCPVEAGLVTTELVCWCPSRTTMEISTDELLAL